jgi:hypothetical protein
VAECNCCDRSLEGITLAPVLVRAEADGRGAHDEGAGGASVDRVLNEDEAPIAAEVDNGSAFLDS